MATEIGPTVAEAFFNASSSPSATSINPVSSAPTSAFLNRQLSFYNIYAVSIQIPIRKHWLVPFRFKYVKSFPFKYLKQI